MDDALSLPPLMRGEAVGADPFAKAVAAAALGADPGLITHRLTEASLEAALVLAPETALEEAMAMVFALSLGFGDALGALAPPEVAVHFLWPGGFRVNGARCGTLRAAASHQDPTAEPDWLVLGLVVPFQIPAGRDPGLDPDATALWEEGCVEITPRALLESTARHTLVWINTWGEGGMAALHPHWRARAWGLGEAVTAPLGDAAQSGTFLGIDERGGMLLRGTSETTLIPLSAMLERR